MAAQERPYVFEHEALYRQITVAKDYEHYLRTLKKGAKEDLPASERKPIKVLQAPLHTRCPYTPEVLETFRTAQQPTQEWLDARTHFLTSSRFGEMTGEHPLHWNTPVDYWRQVTGRVVDPPFTELQQSYTEHGRIGEPLARGVYEHLTGCHVEEEGLRVLDEAPWIYSASSDGLRNGQPEKDGIIEIKCNAVGDARDYVPDHYVAQIMGAMAVYRAPFCDFITYWWRKDVEKRALYATRVYFSEDYWRLLKMRLDYMAWAIVNDLPPTGFRQLKCFYPLPKYRMEEYIFHVGTAAEHSKWVTDKTRGDL